MSLLDILLGIVAIVIAFAVMASVVLVTGAIFYRLHRDETEPAEGTVSKKRKKGKR